MVFQLEGDEMKETAISRVIIGEYSRRLSDYIESDVVIVGAGPAGLTAGYYLAKEGVKVTIVEKKLSIGGGIWGGAAGYNIVVFEDTEIIDEIGIACEKKGDLYIADAIEFATGLGYKARRAGAMIFNLLQVEDIIVKEERVQGVVVNNTSALMVGLHVDPFCISSKYLVDATGHPAEIVGFLKSKKPKQFPRALQEYFMNVEEAEAGVVEKTGEIFDGMFVAGMAVCDVFNLPRMGPIFGGMLKSGKKAAEMINERLKNSIS